MRGPVVAADERVHTADSGGGRVAGEAVRQRRPDPDSLPLVGNHDGGLGRGQVAVAHEVRDCDGPASRACDEDAAAVPDSREVREIGRPQLGLAEAPVP